MRLADIATAVAIGLLSLSTVLVWSPAPAESLARDSQRQASLCDLLAGVVSAKGLVWLQQTSFGGLCSTLSLYSNASVAFSASSAGHSCLAGPPPGHVQCSITVPLPSGAVTLQDWENEGQ